MARQQDHDLRRIDRICFGLAECAFGIALLSYLLSGHPATNVVLGQANLVIALGILGIGAWCLMGVRSSRVRLWIVWVMAGGLGLAAWSLILLAGSGR